MQYHVLRHVLMSVQLGSDVVNVVVCTIVVNSMFLLLKLVVQGEYLVNFVSMSKLFYLFFTISE